MLAFALRNHFLTVSLHKTVPILAELRQTTDSTKHKKVFMGMIELLIGVIIFILLANFILGVVPIPNNIVGVIITLLIIYLVWGFVF